MKESARQKLKKQKNEQGKHRKKRMEESGQPTTGSSRKSANQSNPSVASTIFVDHENRRLISFGNDILLNQLRRDGPKIEASFDALCDADLRTLSSFLSEFYSLLFVGMKSASRANRTLELACSELLTNAANSVCAATGLLRMGYVLQPGILLRSLLESVSMILHLLQRPEDLSKYQDHSLKSPSTIASAKKALPPFGVLYGYFSDNFAHIGQLHKSVTAVRPYTSRDDALGLNINMLRMATWLLYVTTELLFLDLVPRPRYWRPVDEGAQWNPSDDEKGWMSGFFGLELDVSKEPSDV